MTKVRSSEHTSLTETSSLVVHELKKIPGIKLVAPGVIKQNARRRGGGRFVTATYTTAGFELLISGQAVQKVAVHTSSDPVLIFKLLTQSKRLSGIEFKERQRKPGV